MTQRTTGNDTTPGREFIDHPVHYNVHPSGIECIEVIAPMATALGTAVKHLHRAGLKGGEDKYIEDLNKAINYINFGIKYLAVPFCSRFNIDMGLVSTYLQGFDMGPVRTALTLLLCHEEDVVMRNLQLADAVWCLEWAIKEFENK